MYSEAVAWDKAYICNINYLLRKILQTTTNTQDICSTTEPQLNELEQKNPGERLVSSQ